MLSAKIKDTAELIYSWDFRTGHEIREKYKKNTLVCQHCGNFLTPVHRANAVLHFRHIHKCTSALEHHPESAAHIAGKLYLRNQLKKQVDLDCFGIPVTTEYAIPEAGEHGRIADVAAIFPSGYLIVFECQLASIPTENLAKRTEDYLSVGADVYWWLGKSANTEANRQWCVENLGIVGLLDFSEKEEVCQND